MIEERDRGGESPCFAHLVDDLDAHPSPVRVVASNTILYTDRWSEVTAFYRTGLGLRPTMERDWFIEFELYAGVHVSVADASRASIVSGDGAGLTLSWRVPDSLACRRQLVQNGVAVSPIQKRWGAPGFFVTDPAGNRIEFWSERQ
ncbi:MAG: VOC family protein [Ilumatobacter sp.]|uniref:VOC family protein n=1 Tax=Ilumatobacter sp. TaxID=1967498 RepID=UPI0039189CA9